MADETALPPAAQAEGAPNGEPEQQSTFKMLMGTVGRMMFFWMIMNWFKGGGQNQTTTQQAAAPGSPAAKPATNLFKPALLYDMSSYLVETPKVDFTKDEPVWELNDLTFGLWTEGPTADSIYYKQLELDLNAEFEQVRNNGSLYLVSYIFPAGKSPDPATENYGQNFVTKSSKTLTKVKKRKYQETVNLLSGGTERTEDKEKSGTTEWISHWHGNMTISPVYDHTAWPQGKIPAPLDQHIRFNNKGNYYPVLYMNDWWNLQEDYKPINKTDEILKVHLCFQPLSLFKFQLYLSQSYNAEMFSMIQDAEEAEGDKDSMKKMILETQPWLLALTVTISISHTVFEMLAFKNDIQFWKTRENIQGLSIRAVLFNCFCQLIVLLYVCDNDTNFMVKVSIGVGLLIELWKVTKCIKVKKVAPEEADFMGFKFTENRSSGDSETSEYDKLAFKYLGMVCFPLAACYMVYSLYYNEHRGWYSFVLQSAYGFLLTFGFIAMTPQLFINYKLKSTAHLPWRMMTYKALNTFIDDLFAFVIKMPTLYRIGCLRDDVIFLIYLYQKWIYPTDMSRRNEFGITGEQASGDAKPEEIKEDKKPAIENKEETSATEKTVEEKKDD